MSKVRFEHYNYQYHNKNMFAFLGNGFTEAQVEKDAARSATYMRAEDTEFESYSHTNSLRDHHLSTWQDDPFITDQDKRPCRANRKFEQVQLVTLYPAAD